MHVLTCTKSPSSHWNRQHPSSALATLPMYLALDRVPYFFANASYCGSSVGADRSMSLTAASGSPFGSVAVVYMAAEESLISL